MRVSVSFLSSTYIGGHYYIYSPQASATQMRLKIYLLLLNKLFFLSTPEFSKLLLSTKLEHILNAPEFLAHICRMQMESES